MHKLTIYTSVGTRMREAAIPPTAPAVYIKVNNLIATARKEYS
jgi:hypothetical protein